MTPLTRTEREVLNLFNAGLSRLDIAHKRGVKRAAVSYIIRQLVAKGYTVPDPIPNHPVKDRAHALFRAGKTTGEVAAILGFTPSRARFLQRSMGES